MRQVAILIFDRVEVLDFAGPYEAFNVAGEVNDPPPFHVFTVAESTEPVRARGGLAIVPHTSTAAMPRADVLIVPGGAGVRALLHKPQVLAWLREQAAAGEVLASVCTGALLLGAAGLLDGLTVTTHHENLDDLRAITGGRATIVSDQRYIDNGRVLTAGGVSAGIDMALHLVRRLAGDEALRRTLRVMEYPWTPSTALTWPAAAGG
jgi:transcriptional regulator GlxA family with amidase domain